MMRAKQLTDDDILDRIVSADEPSLSPDAARSFLRLKFPAKDTACIRQLLRKNNTGTIDADERIALEKYLRVGQFLDLLDARARVALAKNSQANE
jgi:hypothetical protein